MENTTKKARVIEILVNKYILIPIDLENQISKVGVESLMFEAIQKGSNKINDSTVLVGDIVQVIKRYDVWVIEDVLDRKNEMIRPALANIDQLILILSINNPKPDLALLDKQIALCKSKDISPVICINKVDMANEDEELLSMQEYIEDTYKDLGIKIIKTSTVLDEGIDELKNILKGKITAFSGNSGVGKSSITKKITHDLMLSDDIEIGCLTNDNKRGKHTTKYVKCYYLDSSSIIIDTPGFSSFNINHIEPEELKHYYVDFLKYTCKYPDCNHINESEDVCEVKRNVTLKNIDNDRYERYVSIYKSLKEIHDKRYK